MTYTNLMTLTKKEKKEFYLLAEKIRDFIGLSDNEKERLIYFETKRN